MTDINLKELSLEQLDELIDKEMEGFRVLGVHPADLELDQFMLNCQTQALMNILMDKGIIENDEEFVGYLKRVMIMHLSSARAQITAKAAEADITAGIAKKSVIFAPDGRTPLSRGR